MVGRNDPCPCGSGKKYKKCCEQKQMPSSSQLVSDEAERVLEGYFESVFQAPGVISDFEKQKWRWMKVLSGVDKPENWEDTFGEVYLFVERADLWRRHVMKWLNGPTRSALRVVLESWLEPIFVLAKITAIGDEIVTVEQVVENQVYEFPKLHDMNLLVGGVIFGMALPNSQLTERAIDFISGFDFVRNDNGQLLKEIEQLADASGLSDSHQFYVRHAAELYKMIMTWVHMPITSNLTEGQQKALNFLLKEIKSYSDDELGHELAEGLFTGYYLAKKPNVRKHEGVAAAVFLVIYELSLIPNAHFTQGDIAKRFGVSVSSMTKHLDPLYAILEEVEQASHQDSPTFSYYVGTLPRMTERPNWEMFCMSERGSFETLEQAQQFFSGQMNKSFTPETREEKAQAICYDAYEVKDDFDRMQQLAKDALKLDAESVDAELLLAHAEMSYERAEHHLKEAIRKGEKTFDGSPDNTWYLVTNRPYLRALLAYGVSLYEEERYEKALTYFRLLLELNPDDNQGVRHLAIAAQLKNGQLDQAKRLLDDHKPTETNDATYAFLLWKYEWLRANSESTPKIEQLYQAALTENPFVEVMQKEEMPTLPYPRNMNVEAGSIEEAMYIWSLL